MSNSKVQLYMDTLIIEALLSDDLMIKNAQSGIIGSIIKKIKSMVSDRINPNDKLGSAIDLIAPGILMATGFPILSMILELAESWFGVKPSDSMKDIGNEIKSLISGGIKPHSSDIDAIAQRTTSSHFGTPSQSDLEAAQTKPLTKYQFTLRDAKLYKITLLHLQDQQLIKQGGWLSSLGRFVGLSSLTSSALAKIIGWIFKVVLASAGLMAVDDAIHSVMGSPSHVDYSPSGAGNTTTTPTYSTISFHTPTQTIFKINPNYTEERLNSTDHWIEPVPLTQIGNEIVQWTQDIYPGTTSVAKDIKNTIGFNNALQAIDSYNSTNKLNITFMPHEFTSRQKVVDMFIDELALKSPSTLTPLAPADKPKFPNVPGPAA